MDHRPRSCRHRGCVARRAARPARLGGTLGDSHPPRLLLVRGRKAHHRAPRTAPRRGPSLAGRAALPRTMTSLSDSPAAARPRLPEALLVLGPSAVLLALSLVFSASNGALDIA